MSIRNNIFTYLSTLPFAEGGKDWVPVDLQKAAVALGMSRNSLNAHLSSMAQSGMMEWIKEPNEHGLLRIVGFRHLTQHGKPVPRKKAAKAFVEEGQAQPSEEAVHEATKRIFDEFPKPRTPRMVQTPELDRLREARNAMQAFVDQFPGLIDQARAEQAIRLDGSKIEDYVNEGMALWKRNQALEHHTHELSERLRVAERELGFLRTKNDKQLIGALSDAGVLVQHGED